MANELAIFESTPLQKYDESILSKIITSGDFLPRLQLMTASCDDCKSGKFPINHYALIEGQLTKDLGTSVDVVVCAWRPKAIEIGEIIISVYNPENPEFARIQGNSTEPNSGCMYGPEFLVWIPVVQKFATFFMGSKSARREAPNLVACLRASATLTSREIKTVKYTWYAPSVTPCSTPLTLPEKEMLLEQLNKFNNPVESTVERVDDAGETRAR